MGDLHRLVRKNDVEGVRTALRDPATAHERANKYDPIWTVDRFGQSFTKLPDGRAILIAGEHEDSYDIDFCIYNDVIVFHADGRIQIFGYPYNVFPPTDFHTATPVGDHIYIVGSLGYQGRRQTGMPVWRLDLSNYRIEPLKTSGRVDRRADDRGQGRQTSEVRKRRGKGGA